MGVLDEAVPAGFVAMHAQGNVKSGPDGVSLGGVTLQSFKPEPRDQLFEQTLVSIHLETQAAQNRGQLRLMVNILHDPICTIVS